MKGNQDALGRVLAMLLALAVLLGAVVAPVRADGKSTLAREAADYVLQRFGRTAAKEGAETLARKIESYAARHGDDFFQAIRKAGPQAFRLVEEAGEHAPQAVRALSRYGEEGALWVVSRPRAMSLYVQHGEEAAAALIKHKGIAEPVIEQLGQPAVRALAAVSPQNGRRMAMMLESGELATIGRTPELLGVLEKYGNPACDFVWRNKGALTLTVAAGAFLAEPEPFIQGVKDLTGIVAENAVKPLAEVPATVAREAAGEVARNTNWTWIVSLMVLALGGLAALRMRLKARNANPPPSLLTPGGNEACPR
jgi:hypothetical protein